MNPQEKYPHSLRLDISVSRKALTEKLGKPLPSPLGEYDLVDNVWEAFKETKYKLVESCEYSEIPIFTFEFDSIPELSDVEAIGSIILEQIVSAIEGDDRNATD